MDDGIRDAKRQSKRAEIDNLLQQISSYVKEGQKIAEGINITLLQERVPMSKSESGDVGLRGPDEPSRGWFDTVINRLSNIKHNVEKTNAHLANVHKEVVNK